MDVHGNSLDPVWQKNGIGNVRSVCSSSDQCADEFDGVVGHAAKDFGTERKKFVARSVAEVRIFVNE